MVACARIYTRALIIGNEQSSTLSSSEMSTFPSGVQPFALTHILLSYALHVTMVLKLSWKPLDLPRGNSKICLFTLL